MKFLNKETPRSSNNESFQQIYKLAEEVSVEIANPSYLITIVLESRRKAQNIIKRLKLDVTEVVASAPIHLQELTELIAIKPEAEVDSSVDRLQCISTLIELIKAAKEHLKESFLFAIFDTTLSKLDKTKKELTEQLGEDVAYLEGNTGSVVNNTYIVANSAEISLNTITVNKLSGYEEGVLRKEIIDKFGTKDDFNCNVCSLLGINLEHIGSGDSYTTLVYKLLTNYIIPQGRLPELIQVLVSQRPKSTIFQSFVR